MIKISGLKYISSLKTKQFPNFKEVIKFPNKTISQIANSEVKMPSRTSLCQITCNVNACGIVQFVMEII